MKVDTTRFGIVQIDEASVVTFPDGLAGFESQTRFCLIAHPPDASFRWLQSISDAGLAFVVIDPSDFYTDYVFDICDSQSQAIGLTSPQDALVLAIVTIDRDLGRATCNLAAPIVVNAKTMQALQIVLQEGQYSIAQPVPEKRPSKSKPAVALETGKASVGKAA